MGAFDFLNSNEEPQEDSYAGTMYTQGQAAARDFDGTNYWGTDDKFLTMSGEAFNQLGRQAHINAYGAEGSGAGDRNFSQGFQDFMQRRQNDMQAAIAKKAAIKAQVTKDAGIAKKARAKATSSTYKSSILGNAQEDDANSTILGGLGTPNSILKGF